MVGVIQRKTKWIGKMNINRQKPSYVFFLQSSSHCPLEVHPANSDEKIDIYVHLHTSTLLI